MTRRRYPLNKCKLRKGDPVIVTAGRSKGATGKIEQISRKTASVIISNTNLVKKHTKASQNSAGGIVDKPMPLHISNVALVDPQKGGPTRVGFRFEEGRKIRFAKKSGAIL